jgi:hypothetical protein
MTTTPRKRRDLTGEAEHDLEAAEALAADVTRDELPLPGSEGGGEEKPSAAGEMAAMPAVQELAAEIAAQQVPPAYTPNGHTPSAQALQAVAAALRQLPQQLFQAVSAALQQVPVSVKPGPCGTCFTARVGWFTSHSAEIAKAEAAFQAAVNALAPDDPRRGLVQPLSFLPAALQPSQDPAKPNPQAMPALAEGVILIGGTWYCAQHVPGLPQQPGKLLVASTVIPQGMLGQLFRGQAA